LKSYLEYGMSECGWISCVYLSEHKTISNIQTIGKPNPGVEMKIIDSMGNALPHNSVGEICIRSESVSLLSLHSMQFLFKLQIVITYITYNQPYYKYFNTRSHRDI
jgi:acyl-CoA synthetase (AMP-forming)/AMP-acid ligase II